MKITKHYSSSRDLKKRSSKSITVIILHYTGMQSERESLKKLTNPKSKVSCHYLINRKGKVFSLVKDNYIAWHAGKSMWKKYKNLNKNSIGVELINKGHKYGYQKFTTVQINRLVILCRNLKKKYKIKNQFILGHSDIAPLRKIDPGEKFPWKYLSSKNIGIYPKKIKIKNGFQLKTKNNKAFFKNLYKIGYRYLNKRPQNRIIKNFQRRYRQEKVSGFLDKETLKISDILVKKSNIS
jgi:N-acetylmuramoyl-L-alanine amidase